MKQAKRRIKVIRICGMKDCNNPHYRKGYCIKHWASEVKPPSNLRVAQKLGPADWNFREAAKRILDEVTFGQIVEMARNEKAY